MEHFSTNRHQCLSLDTIQAYLNEDVSKEALVRIEDHFAECALCNEVKDSLSDKIVVEINEDIESLKTAIQHKVVTQKSAQRKLFFLRIAAGFLIPISIAITFFYWTANDRIYKEFFQPYPVELNVKRGDIPTEYESSQPPSYQLALESYAEGDYKECLSHFATYQKKYPNHTFANFLYAIAAMEENQLDKSIRYLEKVRDADKKLSKDAIWYLALAYIKKDEKKVAQNYLNALEKESDPFYKGKIKALKERL